MKRTTFPALGTTWWIEIFDEITEETADEAFGLIRCFLEKFENNYSRFKTHSKVSLLNQQRQYQNPDSELRDIISLGKTLYTQTNGAFNFLVGSILNQRGYNREYTFTATNTAEILPNPVTDISITSESIILTAGEVDLGGFGKGYAIDRCKELLLRFGIRYFLIHGGGDMYATSDNHKPITIYLEHPLQSDTYVSETTLLHQGFAASSPYKRQWRSQARTYSHIVSQDTLPLGATFTKAKTAVIADAFATTALLLPQSELLEYAHLNDVAIAHFDPSLNEIWYTQTF